MDPANRELLVEGAKTFGIDLDEKAIEAFGTYLKELLKWNQKINLTAIRSEKAVVLKHFLDSLSVCLYLPEHSVILDIGSGPGFPGIPLKIVHPTVEVTLMDSVRKKVDFQKHIIRVLGLNGIEAIHGRAQDKGILRDLGGRFDIIVSRAFSDLETLLGLSLPFLKPEGKIVAMKSRVEDEEMALVSGSEGGYRLQRTIPLTLPFSPFKRTILLFNKT